MNLITLAEIPSTNTWLRSQPDAPHATVVSAFSQSAGRGQRGNSWEAAPGKNLTFSILVRPRNIAADRQFAISRATAVAIADTLTRLMPNVPEISVKWPNDIYAGDRKICGILIENVLTGTVISRSVIGVGINVNQEEFLSDAPNPVSMRQLTCREFPVDELLDLFADAIIRAVEAEDSSQGNLTRDIYMRRLWRRDGFYPYRDTSGEFSARIAGVDSMGFLTLQLPDGSERKYAFKEVSFII